MTTREHLTIRYGDFTATIEWPSGKVTYADPGDPVMALLKRGWERVCKGVDDGARFEIWRRKPKSQHTLQIVLRKQEESNEGAP